MKTKFGAAMVVVAALSAPAALAGPFSDELSRCIVGKTSAADKIILARWFTVVYAAHPSLYGVIAVDPSQLESIDRDLAALFMRLITVDCLSEARMAISTEGNSAIEASFNVLGQAAALELVQNSEVNVALMRFGNYVDAAALEQAFPELR